MTKIKIFQTATLLDVVNTVLFLTFGYLLLEFVSDFGFRISSLSGLGFGVQGSKVQGSGFKGCIITPGLHLGCIFTRKASASSGLFQNLELNRQLFGKMSIFNEHFRSFNAFFVLNPEH